MPSSHIIEQAAHSPIGASSCKRWSKCPGSVKLSEGMPNDGTIHSATGTVAHSMGEKWLKSGIYSETGILREIGRSYVEDGFEIEVTEAMIEHVEVYKNAVWESLLTYHLKHVDLQTEVRVGLPHIDAEAFGTCDALIHVPMNRLIVFDYKHGYGAVEVEDNEQCMYYGLGAYYGLPAQDREELIYIELVIVQPRARHLDGKVRRQTLTIEQLLEFERTGLVPAVARVRAGDGTLCAGDWCKFCPAKAICPEIRNSLASKAGLDFSAVETRPVALPSVEGITLDRLAMLIENANTIKGWCDSVTSLGIAKALAGMEVPGYKVVEKTGRRRWINEADFLKAFELEFEDELYNKKPKSPAQMEKVLKKRKGELEPYIETPITGKTLVPVGDARDAVGAVGDDFGEFEL